MKKKNIKITNDFKIPQIDFENLEYINNQKKFEPSIAASPFYGTKVKDKLYIQDAKGKVDVRMAYDNFRDDNNKKISDEEKIAKYGTVYHEFQFVNESTRKKYLNTEYIEEKEEPTVEDNAIIDNNLNNEEVEQVENIDIEQPLKLNLNLDIKYEKEEEISDIVNIIKEENITQDIINDVLDEGSKDEVEDNDEENEVLNYDHYQLPKLDIFNTTTVFEQDTPEWVIENKDVINETLQDFDIDGEVVAYTCGPTFTRYEIMLNSGVKVNKVSGIKDNIQMKLKAKSIRILAPIPGKNTVGVEVPNLKAKTVWFGDIVSERFVHDNHPINVALGKDIDDNAITKRIEDMPHLLVAGATKSGKSVCINTILVSLLIKNKPDEVKLILVDPKKVELAFYENIPHLAAPVITEMYQASLALKWVVDEMDRRYDLFKEVGVKNIETYISKQKSGTLTAEKLPYIVVVIDELADLMMNYQKEVEDHIERITHMARAVGIHLIVATQRPTVQVISGNIKANIPTRIAFKVASSIDSVTILDEGGAEELLGKGDMLIKDNDGLTRLQGCYISDDEIISVCDHIKSECDTIYLFSLEELEGNARAQEMGYQAVNTKEKALLPDKIYYDVARHCIERNSCSLNDVCRAFSYGWNRSKMIVEHLEELGVVGPNSGSSKGRAILVSVEELNKIFNI